jgi:hypothetical protein
MVSSSLEVVGRYVPQEERLGQAPRAQTRQTLIRTMRGESLLKSVGPINLDVLRRDMVDSNFAGNQTVSPQGVVRPGE